MWESQRLELGLEVGKGKGKLKSLKTFEIQEPLLGRGLGGPVWRERRWLEGQYPCAGPEVGAVVGGR